MTVHRLEIEARRGLADPLAEATMRRLDTWLGLRPRALRTRKVYHLDFGLNPTEAARALAALVDPVAEIGALGMLDDPELDGERAWVLSVAFAPGVTDAVGRSVATAVADCLGRPLVGSAYTSTLYSFWGLEREAIERAAKELLYNPLIERVELERAPRELDLRVPRAGSEAPPEVRRVALREADDATLEAISRDGTLSLSVAEMRAIQGHFVGLGRDPTDAELECLAQTWSEHCKHKIFASPIAYTGPEDLTRARLIERGLFRGYIRAATEQVARDRLASGVDPIEQPFLVSVFHDNAGVVRFTADDHLVYKVETHNSPSALDPYGGAMTGIVGVNRDSFGTGLGADLLTNVWGYCFGDPHGDPSDHSGLPPGLMHPRRIRDGVHHGVIDGGNQSGIPYSRGFELFDPRYAGKPLVYCGTVAAMPVTVPGPDGEPRPTEVKPIRVGDKIVMVGGRIGKDGIHGATFSSVELDERSPVQAVQIGDPITQKLMWDFLTEARDRGLYSGMTDNGAGGLSSSVGELAGATNGARIDLAAAPLKYPGLAPWEILISEAQERMTIAVPEAGLDAFLQLAKRREVEASVLGEFTDDGRFEVRYGAELVCDLALAFLHDGVPLPTLTARWSKPAPVPELDRAHAQLTALDPAAILVELLRRPNLAANDDRARHYDHEVKGLSVVKPLIGVHGDVPSTATVMRVRHGRDEGVVLGEGIHPWYSDVDTDAMAKACLDEAVRRVLCAGARIDRIAALDNFCWPDPVKSSKTPDGEHKLAQLVRCCEGLYAACVGYGVPLISGKDSMKNDAYLGGVKISIPPTLLVSVIGQTSQVANSLTLEPRGVGDRVYLLGPTALELDGSELARLADARGEPLATTEIPRTDLARCWARYQAFTEQRDAGRIRSAHVCGRGGLGVALAHMVLAAELGLVVDLDDMLPTLPVVAALGSESTGRIVLTCRDEDSSEIEATLAEHGLIALGQVIEDPRLELRRRGQPVLSLALAQLRAPFSEGLHGL